MADGPMAAPAQTGAQVIEEAPVILETAAGALSGVLVSRVIGGLDMVQGFFGDWSIVVGGVATLVVGLIAYHFAGKNHPHAKNYFMGMSVGGAAVLLNELLTAFLGMNLIGQGGGGGGNQGNMQTLPGF